MRKRRTVGLFLEIFALASSTIGKNTQARPCPDHDNGSVLRICMKGRSGPGMRLRNSAGSLGGRNNDADVGRQALSTSVKMT